VANELRTYFQPIVSLETGRITFEALVRWIHPKRGFVHLPRRLAHHPLVERDDESRRHRHRDERDRRDWTSTAATARSSRRSRP
jgi:predicted signal transduction protein with EAL and GGDEF domain